MPIETQRLSPHGSLQCHDPTRVVKQLILFAELQEALDPLMQKEP